MNEKDNRCVAKTKRSIRSAFASLMQEKRNISDISISELIKRADIARSTFYYHYDDIYQVEEDVENELLEKIYEMIDAIKNSDYEDNTDYLRRVIRVLKENGDLYRAMTSSTDSRFLIGKVKSTVAKNLLDIFTKRGLFANVSEAEISIRFFTNAVVETIADYFNGQINTDIETLEEVVIATLKKSLSCTLE